MISKPKTIQGVLVLPEDFVPSPHELTVGEKYHTNWGHPKCVWELRAFENQDMVLMVTPKTGKEMRTSQSSLRHIKKNALKTARARIKNQKQ